MHTYLESVGFQRIGSNREMERITRDTVLHFDHKTLFRNGHNRICGEFSKEYGRDMGITVVGEFDDAGDFHPEYSFPYFSGATISMHQEVDFEKRAGSESYEGCCEDPRLGATVIFYLINAGQYRRITDTGANEMQDPDETLFTQTGELPVKLSALAKSGTILLPVYKTEEDQREYQKHQDSHLKLISAARNGDEAAIESLTAEDMNDYQVITKRLEDEDVLSIVDTSFLPYGMECDQYSVIGNIISCERVKNLYTGESVWQMQLEVCDVYLDVCVNAKRLRGVPRKGMRFRGDVWLQGIVYFNE